MVQSKKTEIRPHAYDLFGDVPVYPQDIESWLLAIPKIEPGSPRAIAYIQNYDVVSKIKAAKREGRFDEVASRVSDRLNRCVCFQNADRNLRIPNLF
jgi:hypothetical protein